MVCRVTCHACALVLIRSSLNINKDYLVPITKHDERKVCCIADCYVYSDVVR